VRCVYIVVLIATPCLEPSTIIMLSPLILENTHDKGPDLALLLSIVLSRARREVGTKLKFPRVVRFVHLIGMRLKGIYFMSTYFTGMYPTCAYLMGMHLTGGAAQKAGTDGL
jgi:hypothetical protein